MPNVKLTKEARQLSRDVRHQIQVANSQEERVAKGMAENWNAQLSEALTTARLVLKETSNEVVERMESDDLALSTELADNPGLLDRRTEAQQTLYAAMIQFKGNVSSVLGRQGLVLYGLSGETPQDPRRLRDEGAKLLKLLAEQPQVVETPLGGRLDTEIARVALEPMVAELRSTVEAVDEDSLDDTNARHDRDAAIQAAITIERSMRLVGEVACRLADATELLRQLRRPSLRRSGSGVSNDGEPIDTDEESDVDGEGGTTPIDNG